MTICLLIQGPYHENIEKTLSQHKNKFSEIIVSGYNSDIRAEGFKTIYTDPPLISIRNNTIQFQIHK